MAAQVYYSWDAAGRPVVPAEPIRDYVTRLKVTFPRGAAANLFGWYANEAHYQANPPQDHTPFSATGWPLESPHWFVFATDVMHRPDLGVDCNVLFPYWLAEAKAGRTPWVKYLIWQAKLYDVRNQWRPQSNSGHFDHIHISVRTDWQNKGLGDWSLTPVPAQGGNAMAVIIAWPPGVPGSLCFSNGSSIRHIPNEVALGQIKRGFPGIPTVTDAALWPADVVHQLYGPDGPEWGAKLDPPTVPGEEEMVAIAERVARDMIGETKLTPPA